MKSFVLTNTQDKITKAALTNTTAPLISGPSVLIVMRSGILQHSVPVAFTTQDVSINQDMRAFTVKDAGIIDPEFLAHYLQHMTHELLSIVKWGVTVQSMNTDELESFNVVIPPLKIQKQLVAEVNVAREKIATERAAAEKLAADTAREVEEMILGHLPAPTIS
jgi:type I restriction enzyme S subunit